MPTIDVLDANGDPVTLEKPNANGQQTMANSRPIAIASDQTDLPVILNGGVNPWSSATLEAEGWKAAGVIYYNGIWTSAIGLTKVGDSQTSLSLCPGEAFYCMELSLSTDRPCHVQAVVDLWGIDNIGFFEPSFSYRERVHR